VRCPLFKETWIVDHDFVRRYGSTREMEPADEDNKVVVIDEEMLAKYPMLLR
jgi:hypothetical protein